MIDPHASYQQKIHSLARAGSNGLPLGEVGIGTALHFALHGLAKVHDGEERVQITPQGRVYAHRGAFA